MARDCGIEHGEFLSANAESTFGLIAAGLPVPEGDADFVAELVEWGCVTLDAERGNRPIALNPKRVAVRRLERDVEQAMQSLERLRSLPSAAEALYGQYARAQLKAGGSAEYIDDAVVVNARLDDVVGSAQSEILSAQPAGPRTRVQLNRSLERDTAALERGVEKRTLYRATVRDNQTTAEYARQMANRPTGRSGQFRTLVEPFERIIIVDRQTAFMTDHLVAGGPEHAAWQVTDQAVIAYMVTEFEAKWRRANPWHGELRGRGQVVDTVSGPDGVRTSRRQREILRDIVAGRAQQSTADRLGISLRTLTGEIADLKSLFDAASLPELTYRWALSPDRLVDDSAPDAEDPATTASAA